MRVTFQCDPEKCSACGACAVACMDQNDIDVEHGQSPLRRVIQYEEKGRRYFMSIACAHCEDAPCVRGCPTGCLYKSRETGLTLFDRSRCIGCHSCAMECPYGAPTFVEEDGRERMLKCDGCIERLKNGMEPACVRACPVGALTCRSDGEPGSGEFCRVWPHIRVEQ